MIHKNIKKLINFSFFTLQFLVFKTLDQDSLEMLDLDPQHSQVKV